MTPKYKNSKYSRITETLIKEIKSGNKYPDGFFATRSETAERFSIGLITVAKIYTSLEKRGYIKQKSKHRPEIIFKTDNIVAAKPDKPIALLFPGGRPHPFHKALWVSLVLIELQRLLLSRSFDVTVKLINEPIANFSDMYSGLIFFGMSEKYPSIVRELAASGKPYAIIATEKMQPNSVFINGSTYLQKIALEIMRRKIRIIYLISTGNVFQKKFIAFHEREDFCPLMNTYNYQYEIRSMYFEDKNDIQFAEKITPLANLLASSPNEKVVICAADDYLANRICHFLQNRNIPETAYDVIAYTSSSMIPPSCDYIDFDVIETASSLVEIILQQIKNNTTYSPGCMLVPVARFKNDYQKQ